MRFLGAGLVALMLAIVHMFTKRGSAAKARTFWLLVGSLLYVVFSSLLILVGVIQ